MTALEVQFTSPCVHTPTLTHSLTLAHIIMCSHGRVHIITNSHAHMQTHNYNKFTHLKTVVDSFRVPGKVSTPGRYTYHNYFNPIRIYAIFVPSKHQCDVGQNCELCLSERKGTHTYTHSHPYSLITDDDGSYLPRPEWAKATGANTIQIYGDTNDLHIDSTLSDLEEEALYISRDALEDFVPIGEGMLKFYFGIICR